jgi:hypothetical protein
MADRPQMAIGALIVVGSGIRAVVAWVRARGAPRGDGVAVYLDDAKKALYDNVQWTGTHWKFVREPPSGHDAKSPSPSASWWRRFSPRRGRPEEP